MSTINSIVHVKSRERKTQILLQKDCKPLRAVACHPKQSTVAMGNGCGFLQVWDYSNKTLVCSRLFENKNIRCIAIDSQGKLRLAGCLCLRTRCNLSILQRAKALSCSLLVDSAVLGSRIRERSCSHCESTDSPKLSQ